MKNRDQIKICIVLSTFDRKISNALFDGATQRFIELGGLKDNITLYEVPGAFEIPGTVKTIIDSASKYDVIISLGCVIKGETPHFDFISHAATQAIMSLSIDHKKPIGNGIITSLNKKQALIRSKIKGQEAAKAVLSVLKNF